MGTTVRAVALLRGINVGGARPLPMADLRELLGALGLDDVRTYIQSGNAVFTVAAGDLASLPARIAAAIADRWGYEVPVVVRSAAELRAAAERCPFGELAALPDGTRVGIGFLDATPRPGPAADLVAKAVAPEELVVAGDEVHLHCPDGFGKSRLTTALIEKTLGLRVTVRNARTVLKLLDLAG